MIARARSVQPTRFGTTTIRCDRPIPTLKVFSPISPWRRRGAPPACRRPLCSRRAARGEAAGGLAPGGRARAVVCALLQREVGRVYVINRTRDRAQALKKKFGNHVHLAGWNETTGLLGGAGILVNTTTLGMAGKPPLEINLRCPASLVVADLVYAPLETGLLAAARARGLLTADGL